jgi:hypothetical protein
LATRGQNFEIYAGDSKNITVTVTNADGSPIDLTGATIKWALKKRVSSPADITKETNTNAGISVANPTTGVFLIPLKPDDTKDLSGVFYHEAEVTDGVGNVSTVLTGEVTIHKSGV